MDHHFGDRFFWSRHCILSKINDEEKLLWKKSYTTKMADESANILSPGSRGWKCPWHCGTSIANTRARRARETFCDKRFDFCAVREAINIFALAPFFARAKRRKPRSLLFAPRKRLLRRLFWPTKPSTHWKNRSPSLTKRIAPSRNEISNC